MSGLLQSVKKQSTSFIEILYSSPRTLLAIILLVTCLKASLIIYLTQCSNPEIKLGNISFSSGDTFSYTGATENLVTHGSYYFYNGKENVYAGRTPHYGVIYFLLRLLFDMKMSYDILIVIQLLIESIAIFYLFRLCYQLTSSKIASLAVLAICLISTNWLSFSLYASPESLSISFLIFFLYRFRKYTITRHNLDLVNAGLFLSILVCLKVYYILVFLPVGAYFFWEDSVAFRQLLGKVIFKSALISLPLFVLLTPWVIRNYVLLDRFIPFQINSTAGYNYSNSELAFRKYVTSWGGEIIFWSRNSAGCYFMPWDKVECDFQMPTYAFTRNFGATQVEEVRAMYIRLQHNYSDSLDRKVSTLFLQMHNEYKAEKPVEHYILSPARLTYKFLVHSGSYYLPIHKSNPCYSSFQLPIKAAQSFSYWLCLLIGLPGILILAYQKREIILPFIPIMLIILFPIVLKTTEARYFRTVEPILLIGVGYVIHLMINRVKSNGAKII